MPLTTKLRSAWKHFKARISFKHYSWVLAGLLEFSNSMSPLLSDNDGFFEYGQLVQYEWWPFVNRWNGAVTTGALWGTATTIWRSSTG